ncbi:MAG: hypothetical protein M3P08_01790 [Thermoproteota archaeon]|nr:hypothetical protein [Thermoproteota archaeon]
MLSPHSALNTGYLLLINEKIHSNYINEKKRFTMMAVVLIVGIILGTISVTTLSPQLSYAQNASRGGSVVNNQTTAGLLLRQQHPATVLLV